jgi:hypothetical protein
LTKRFLLPFAVAVILMAGAWMALKPPDLDDSVGDGAAAEVAPTAQGAARPGAMSPGAAAAGLEPAAAPAARPAAAVPPTLTREFLEAKQYRALYERLKASAEGATPEGAYVLYEIAQRCATVSDRPSRRNFAAAAKPLEQRREEFLAAIPPTDPLRDKRIAAFEDVNINKCAGFEGFTLTQAELGKMLGDAASAGNPNARALQLEQEVQAARRGRWDAGTLTDAQLESLKQVLATRDPAAMLTAGRLLANPYNDLTLRLGPDGQVVEPRALANAWQVLACSYGYPCGEGNPRLLAACAYQAHCNASNLPDYLSYYGSSPHDSQLISQYQTLLRNAIETGDWSQLAVSRGPRPPGVPGLPPGGRR